VKKKFKKFIIFLDRAHNTTQRRSKVVQEYLEKNGDNVRVEYFPVG
jgi:hypothetical protein